MSQPVLRIAPEADWKLRKQEAVERIFDVIESHRRASRRMIAYSALSPPTSSATSASVRATSSTVRSTLDQLLVDAAAARLRRLPAPSTGCTCAVRRASGGGDRPRP